MSNLTMVLCFVFLQRTNREVPRYSNQTIHVLKNVALHVAEYVMCCQVYATMYAPLLQGTRNGHTTTWPQWLGTTFLSGWCSSTAVSSVPTRRCCGRIFQPSSFSSFEYSLLNLTTWILKSVIRYPMPACFPSPSFPPSKLFCNTPSSAQSFFLQ